MARMDLRVLFFVSLMPLGTVCAEQPDRVPTFRLAQPGENVDLVGTVPFVTNRQAVAVGKQTEQSATAFLDHPTSELKYGEILFRLKGSVHKLGKLDETVQLGKRSRLTEASSLQRGKDAVVVYLHGYNNSFDGAVQQSVLLHHDLALPFPLMAFSWASQGTPVSYHLDRLDIQRNAAPLAEFILKLAKDKPKGSVHFIVHSMGNDVFLEAIGLLEKQGDWKNLTLGKVILAAPDVQSERFSERVTLLVQRAQKVVHYFSTKDRPLFFSRFANPAQGVRAGSRVLEVPGLEVIDVDQVNSPKDRMGHGYFAGVPEVLGDISLVLQDSTSRKTAADRQKEKVEEVRTLSGFSYFRFR